MTKKIKINFFFWLFWLMLVVLWNYSFPTAKPIEDVVVAIVLSLLNIFLNSKFTNLKKN